MTTIRNIILLFLFLTDIAVHAQTSGTDNKVQKYDINDPRNPDCPCHQHQKLADEEYKKLMKNDSGNSVVGQQSGGVERKPVQQVNVSGSGGSGGKGKRKRSFGKSVKSAIVMMKWNSPPKFRQKVKFRVADCFKWY